MSILVTHTHSNFPPQNIDIPFNMQILPIHSRIISTGFLLGKFVSDRQYRIRQLQEAEYVNLIRELHTIRKSIEMSADNISSFSAEQLQVKYNRKLWDTVANCTSTTIEHDFNVLFDQFVAKLVDNELKLVVECFQKIKTTVKSIEFESNWVRKYKRYVISMYVVCTIWTRDFPVTYENDRLIWSSRQIPHTIFYCSIRFDSKFASKWSMIKIYCLLLSESPTWKP